VGEYKETIVYDIPAGESNIYIKFRKYKNHP
jgi:hypothetical protein